MTTMLATIMRTGFRAAILVGAAGALAACAADEALVRSTPDTAEAALFARYVALGNSITAGFQSAGINDSTQREAYPVLLAERAGVPFGVPSLAMPGCAPPLLEPLAGERVGGGDAGTCALRETPGPRLVQNLAVPGALIADVLDNVAGPGANPLTTLILGGRTQAEAMVAANPTLVSVWIGNNDALAAGLAANPDLLTPLDGFRASLSDLAGAIDESTAETAILIGAVNPVVVPALQPGAYFWALGQTDGLPKPVGDTCAPRTAQGEPNPLAANLVSFFAFAGPEPSTIECSDDAPFVLTPDEQQRIAERTAAFNAAIAETADANGWLYVNPNALLQPFLSDPNAIRKCQGLADAGTPAEFQRAVAETCPNPDAPNFFGSLISLDGVHPSAAAHEIVANALAEALNDELGLSL